jgi:hypothetical protein
MNIHPMGSQLFHADGKMDGRMNGQSGRQLDMTKLIVAIPNFEKAPTSGK